MRFAVESWSPEYGAPIGDEALVESAADVDAWVEVPVEQWAPRGAPPGAAPIADIVFVDGVQRVDANVWITDDDGEVHQAMCASYAAGAVRCNGSADVVAVEVRRGLFSKAAGAEPIHIRRRGYTVDFALQLCTGDSPEQLSLGLHAQRGELEGHVAASLDPVELVVVDGRLRLNENRPGRVGLVKTHHASYGPTIVREVIARLGVGERTPLLLVGGSGFHRFTWYLRLPCAVAHGWAGVVRIEASADQPLDEAITLADRLCRTLPRFASQAHKDPRAPQNLYPIGGLERDLRRRMGDPALILRSLQAAAAAAG